MQKRKNRLYIAIAAVVILAVVLVLAAAFCVFRFAIVGFSI